MNPATTRELLALLRDTSHRYTAIRPADATPAEAPGILIGGHAANDLAYAFDDAGEQWPQCQQWALIGSDELLIRIDPTWPPRMRSLRMPDTLATFATA
jgi:hypothetical protein